MVYSRPREGSKSSPPFEHICRVRSGNPKVIGITTDAKIKNLSAYDYCLMDIPEVTEKFKNDVDKMQKDLGILINPTQAEVHEDEYHTKK